MSGSTSQWRTHRGFHVLVRVLPHHHHHHYHHHHYHHHHHLIIVIIIFIIIVVLAFQCNRHLFPSSLTSACPFFPSSVLCKSSSSSNLHLLRGLPFFLVPPIEALAILLKFFGFIFFQHDHNILVGGSLQILLYIPFIVYLFSPCLFCSPVGGGAREIGYLPIILWMPLVQSP